MRRTVKYILAIAAVLICAAVMLFIYAVHQDQERFREAKNDCERNCLQDSGGLMQCREVCTHHPNHYDNP
jgi:cytochrome c-type biogenesis protein CcmE